VIDMAETSIPFGITVGFCKKYREENKVCLFSQCWGCSRFSKANPEKTCFYIPSSNNGCNLLINYLKKQTKDCSNSADLFQLPMH
jgi:hypothetical protein